MNSADKLPALRPLNITPFHHTDGRVFFELRDMQGIAQNTIAVSGAAYFILAHLDGAHALDDIRDAFREQSGQDMPADEVEQLIAILDENHLLQTPAYEAAAAEALARYRAAPARDNRARWPAEAALRDMIESVFEHALPTEHDARPVRGLVAPHLDYPRGAPCYAAAYGLLREDGPADRYVILGTNHFGAATGPVVTEKDFLTPFGTAATDAAFIERLETALGHDLRAAELDHVGEHSVELQVHVLQWLFPDAAFRIVPILCPDLPGSSGARPNPHGPSLDDLARALAHLVQQEDEKTVVIAGADLSHVGQSFGDAQRTTRARLEQVEQVDRQLVGLLEQDDADGFAAVVAKEGNPTQICSLGGLYVQRRVLSGSDYRLLGYHQAIDPASDTNVTCYAAVIY